MNSDGNIACFLLENCDNTGRYIGIAGVCRASQALVEEYM